MPMVLELQKENDSHWAAIRSNSATIDCTSETFKIFRKALAFFARAELDRPKK
ncbi:MAG: hypothetical protein OES79_16135 [Planctomycetota bacterium]|jgi:hypothetical protein|nr:hypothetical protein [Planctomycetota bacterium]